MSEVVKIATFEASYDVPSQSDLDWAFPNVASGMEPFGGRIIVQLRRIKKKSERIVLVQETKENEKWNNMIGKVIAVGPLAYKNRDTMQSWPEGSWVEVGDYIRVPKWGGDRWEVKVPGEDDLEDPALFMVLNDHEIIASLTGDPLAMKAFL